MTGRRVALYFTWDAPRELRAPLGVLEDRFPTLFELRRAAFPHFEHVADAQRFDQGIGGFLNQVVLPDFDHMSRIVTQHTGHPVTRVERVAASSASAPRRFLDDAFFDAHDTVIVIGLDHLRNDDGDQRPQVQELTAVRRFLARSNSRLILCPHHQVGASAQAGSRVAEHAHHGDALVPVRQCLGGFVQALLQDLQLPIEARFGLRPALDEAGHPAPLEIDAALDRCGFLRSVTTFNAHGHLPHLQVAPERRDVRVLARQRIAPSAPTMSFTELGNTHFNALVYVEPEGERRGEILSCDATLFSAAFGGLGSLEQLWKNIA